MPFYGLAVLCIDHPRRAGDPAARRASATSPTASSPPGRLPRRATSRCSRARDALRGARARGEPLGRVQRPHARRAQRAERARGRSPLADELGVALGRHARRARVVPAACSAASRSRGEAGRRHRGRRLRPPPRRDPGHAARRRARPSGGGVVVAVFQPHRYTRTRDLFEEFATAFNDADVLLVTDIYAAGEEPIAGRHRRGARRRRSARTATTTSTCVPRAPSSPGRARAPSARPATSCSRSAPATSPRSARSCSSSWGARDRRTAPGRRDRVGGAGGGRGSRGVHPGRAHGAPDLHPRRRAGRPARPPRGSGRPGGAALRLRVRATSRCWCWAAAPTCSSPTPASAAWWCGSPSTSARSRRTASGSCSPAGAPVSRLVPRAQAAGLVGCEFVAGIPGTLGGAAAMNAGTRLGEMKDVVDAVEVGHRRGAPARARAASSASPTAPAGCRPARW